jgi:hypothetical protein
MNRPRFIIQEAEGRVIVQLFNAANHLLLSEELDEGEDPYDFITAIRDNSELAQVIVKPNTGQGNCTMTYEPKENVADSIQTQIRRLESIVSDLRNYVNSLEPNEKSFTDGYV